MLRALLVDDEPLALEGLKLLIDWQAEGFAVCGECASAHEALEKLPLAKPDLIVTDIRMPGMNGLELLEASRKAGFEGQFVIVSGYGDFSYAKSALQLGVAGYLLKPVEPADAAEVLAHVRQKLIDREAASNQPSRALHHAITALLTGYDVPGVPTAARWALATWGAPMRHQTVQALLSLLPPGSTAHIVEDKEYLVVRLAAAEALPDFQKAEALLRHHQRQLHTSVPTEDPQALAAMRKQLSDTLDSACRGALPGHVDALVHAVALRQIDECAARCHELEIFCAAHSANALPRARRQLITACAGLLAERENAVQTFLRAQDNDLQALCLLAVKLLAPEQERASDRMEHYALEHCGESITVGSVAAALGYNPTYLGRKFCEERGVGFREWLTGQRMRQSAQLLRTTKQPVNSIAEAVGYEHYKRFLQHFKQYYGMTPGQYRRQEPQISQ